ncbi:MAG: response regulator transcription factor [Spirochaetaceae bacterium]
MRGNILIIEDEAEIAELITLYLENDGITTFHAPSGEEGLKLLSEKEIDLIILDINLPGIDGFEVLQKLRVDHITPVIIVSARTDDSDLIMGFGIGADDFVSKPFSPKVLTARVRAHLRRIKLNSAVSKNIIKFGNCVLDLEFYSLKKDDKVINLSPKEIEIVIYLVNSRGKKRSQEDIYEAVWGSTYGDISTVTVHMRRIRQKIEDDPQKPKFFKTSHGFGYFFEAQNNDI